MIIELCGFPGSGKSTLARQLEKEKKLERIKVRSRFELIWLNMLFAFWHPIFFLYTFMLVCRHAGAKLFYYKFMNTFLQHNAVYQKARMKGRGLITEGFRTNLYSLYEKQMSKDHIKAYARMMPQVDLLVVFDIDKVTRDKRIEERGYLGRHHVATKKEQDRWYNAMSANNDTIVAALMKLTKNHLIVRNDQDVQLVFKSSV